MPFACWITKATETHSKFAILIAFPRQKWLRERALLLRLYVHCLSRLLFSLVVHKVTTELQNITLY